MDVPERECELEKVHWLAAQTIVLKELERASGPEGCSMVPVLEEQQGRTELQFETVAFSAFLSACLEVEFASGNP